VLLKPAELSLPPARGVVGAVAPAAPDCFADPLLDLVDEAVWAREAVGVAP
jgi:hypothetical protein